MSNSVTRTSLSPLVNATEFGSALADAGARIAAALASLPATGGIVDARGLTGPQSLSANPFASPKPFVVLLGAATYTTRAPLAFGKDDITGQYILGAGPDLTVIEPAAGFTGAAVIQL